MAMDRRRYRPGLMAARLLSVVMVVIAVALHAAPAYAQGPSTTTTTLAEVPAQDIVPQPNSGDEPHDPGDRGGTLQLAVLGLVVLGVAGVVVLVVRQSRRARSESG